MDFTRQPIIESVITPKEGCKLVVRSSKSSGQEEFFVDAVEVVTFGSALFFRSIERPKAFLVPASDYEVLEVRESRMVLKNVGVEKSIKIAGGRESKQQKEAEKAETYSEPSEPVIAQPTSESKEESRSDKHRERRRYRRKRGKGEDASEETEAAPAVVAEGTQKEQAPAGPAPAPFSSLLPPPPTLISETLSKYRDNALFKGAFFDTEKEASAEGVSEGAVPSVHPEDLMEALNMQSVTLDTSEYGYFDHPESLPGVDEIGPIPTFDLTEEVEEKPQPQDKE